MNKFNRQKLRSFLSCFPSKYNEVLWGGTATIPPGYFPISVDTLKLGSSHDITCCSAAKSTHCVISFHKQITLSTIKVIFSWGRNRINVISWSVHSSSLGNVTSHLLMASMLSHFYNNILRNVQVFSMIPAHLLFPFGVLFTLLTLIGVIGNLIVIIAIAGDQKMRKSVMNVLLLNLVCNSIFTKTKIISGSGRYVQSPSEHMWMGSDGNFRTDTLGTVRLSL